MPDRDLQAILNSGEITNVNIGGTTSDDASATIGDLTATNTDFDNSPTSLAATTVQAALVELANVGLAHMHLLTPYTGGQTLNTTPVKVSLFDNIGQNINGAITPVVDTNEATPTHTYTIDKAGLYDVSGTVTAEFASANAVTMYLYVNGVAVGHNVSLQGRGAGKPVQFVYQGLKDFIVDDVIEVYASADASTSFLVTSSHMVVERKPLT